LRKTAENLYRVIGFPFAWQKGAPVITWGFEQC
jgi:hypothetical protein